MKKIIMFRKFEKGKMSYTISSQEEKNIMKCSEKQDIKSKKIYEGDILRINFLSIPKIVRESTCILKDNVFGVNLILNKQIEFFPLEYFKNIADLEVVGNIFEGVEYGI